MILPVGCDICHATMIPATKTSTILACPYCDLMFPKGPRP